MRSRTNKLRDLVATYWQPAVFYGMLILFFGALLWFKLGTLQNGYSSNELATFKETVSLRHIFDNPVNAPFTILAYLIGLVYSGDQSLIALRLAASALGLLALTTFYWLVRHWHGERSAVLGTTVFGCSAWFLHSSRLGTVDILMFMVIALLACTVWLKRTENPVALLSAVGLVATSLYIPGMVWFVLAGAIWQGRTLIRLPKKQPKLIAAAALGLAALLSPLAWAIFRSPELVKTLAGLPTEGWPKVTQVLSNLIHIPYNLFVRGPLNPEHWLARLAILDAFSAVMLVLGAYLFIRHFRLVRTKIVMSVLVIGTVLASLGGVVTISILIPIVYLFVAAGVGFMLDRWQMVFPRNVIAQSIGVGLISLAVIASSWYSLRHYFIAWPNAQATKQVFTINKRF